MIHRSVQVGAKVSHFPICGGTVPAIAAVESTYSGEKICTIESYFPRNYGAKLCTHSPRSRYCPSQTSKARCPQPSQCTFSRHFAPWHGKHLLEAFRMILANQTLRMRAKLTKRQSLMITRSPPVSFPLSLILLKNARKRGIFYIFY